MMKQVFLPILLLFFLTPLFTGCQDRKHTATTLVQAEALMYTHPDSALQMLEAIPYPELLTGQEQADYALMLSLIRYRCYIPAASDSLINIAMQYYEDKDNADRCAATWYAYGGIIDEMGKNRETVIHAYKEAENYIPQMKDSALIALIYSNLAYLNKKALQYELAKSYYQKAENINQLTGNHNSLASNYLNLCGIYWGLNQQDDYQYCVDKMLALCPKLTDSILLAKIYHNIGIWHKHQAKWMEAKRFLIRSLQCTPTSPSYKTLAALANLYISEGKQQAADSLYRQALSSTDLSVRATIYQSLYQEKAKLEHYEEAFTQAKNYIAVSDSFYKAQLYNKTLEAQLKYEQLALRHKNASMERNLYLSMLIIIIVFFVACIIIRFYRKRQQEMTSIIHILQRQIDDLKTEMNLKNEYEKSILQSKIDQLEKLKHIYTSQGFLDIRDIKAAGTMKTIVNELKYVPKNDRSHLTHWLNTYRNGFAVRLKQVYPQITQERHLDVCYLSAAGFDVKHIARLLDIKERSVERYMTEICKKVFHSEEGKKGFQTLILQLCIHPEIKKEAEIIATFEKFK